MAFAKAAHVTRLDLTNNRLIPNAIEPRACLGSYERATVRVGKKTLTALSHPFDGLIDLGSRPDDGCFLWINKDFGAKTTTNVRRNDA